MAGASVTVESESTPSIDQSGSWATRTFLGLGGIWLLAFAPAFWVHFGQLAATEHLSHFPLTILLAAALFYFAYQAFPTPSFRWSVYGAVLLGLSALVLAGAFSLRSGWLGTLSALVAFWATVELFGRRMARDAGRGGFIMMFALLQPPFGMDISLVIALQKLASRVASSWLDWQGVANLVTGVVIRTPDRDYLVDQACSGVNSLFAAMTVALFWVLYSRYHWIRSIVFLASVVFWVLLINAVRVWMIVYFDQRSSLDLTTEPLHTVLGLVTFGGVMFLSASTDWLFAFCLPPETPPDYPEPPQSKPALGRTTWACAAATAVMTFVVLAIALFRPASTAVARGTIPDATLMPKMSAETLPERIGSWERRNFERVERDPSSAFGLVSQGWQYSNGEFPIQINIDGPYTGWHDLGYCYGAIGWQLRDSQNVELSTGPGMSPMTCVELNLYRGDGERSLVMFTSLDSTGAVVRPPASHGTIFRNITNRLGVTNAQVTVDGRPVVPPIFQIQVFSQTPVEIDPTDRSSIDSLYDVTRRIIADRLANRSTAVATAAGSTTGGR